MRLREDSTGDLATIDVPTLVVGGEEDVLTPPAIAREMASAISQAELVILSRVGHLTPLEAPEEVTHALRRLLERVSRSELGRPSPGPGGRPLRLS
jgi:pimeloyl-ACP methyl ester carboxylesterase